MGNIFNVYTNAHMLPYKMYGINHNRLAVNGNAPVCLQCILLWGYPGKGTWQLQ